MEDVWSLPRVERFSAVAKVCELCYLATSYQPLYEMVGTLPDVLAYEFGAISKAILLEYIGMVSKAEWAPECLPSFLFDDDACRHLKRLWFQQRGELCAELELAMPDFNEEGSASDTRTVA